MQFHPLFPRYVNCPAGAQYYVCDASDYLGCCKVDACHYDEGCPADQSVVGTTMGAATTTTPAATTTAVAATTSAQQTTTAATTTSAEPTSSTTLTYTPSVEPFISFITQSTTLTTTATTSGTSTTGDRVSVTTATATTTATFVPVTAHSSKSFPKGAIGGIVAAVVVIVLAVAAFLLFQRRRQQALNKKDANNGSDERMLSDDNKPGAPTPTTSPMGEKGVFQSPTPMSTASTPAFGGSDGFSKGPVEMPASGAVLFGELDGSEAAIARYGPHGAHLKGGAYPAIAELDSAIHSRVELESPQPTPSSTPLSTPQVGSVSPNPSLMSSNNGGRSTLVSSWRSSTGTMGTDVIAEEQPSRASLMGLPTLQEQQDVPLVYDAQGEAAPAQQQAGPVTDSPRPNLDLSHNERGSGVNVASWNSYQT